MTQKNLIAILGDSHFGVRKNSPIMLQHQAQFFQKLFFPVLEKLGIKTFIHMGDLFHHRKNVDFFTLNESKKFFFEECRKRGLKCILVCGNHDTYFTNTNDLNSVELLTQEYNFETHKSPITIKLLDKQICLIPWITSENKEQAFNEIKNTKAELLFGHLELNGFNMSKGHPCINGLSSDEFKKFHSVYSGHFHLKQSKDNVHYVGTPYEMDWGDYNEPKGFHILNLDTNECKFIQNKDCIFNKICYGDELVKNNIENKWIKFLVKDSFDPLELEKQLKIVRDFKPSSLNVIEEKLRVVSSDSKIINSEHISTPELITQYVDELQNIDDKDILKTFMLKLYDESSELK